jgi:hypothetical protein
MSGTAVKGFEVTLHRGAVVKDYHTMAAQNGNTCSCRLLIASATESEPLVVDHSLDQQPAVTRRKRELGELICLKQRILFDSDS